MILNFNKIKVATWFLSHFEKLNHPIIDERTVGYSNAKEEKQQSYLSHKSQNRTVTKKISKAYLFFVQH
jgi:hypothetical protein